MSDEQERVRVEGLRILARRMRRDCGQRRLKGIPGMPLPSGGRVPREGSEGSGMHEKHSAADATGVGARLATADSTRGRCGVPLQPC